MHQKGIFNIFFLFFCSTDSTHRSQTFQEKSIVVFQKGKPKNTLLENSTTNENLFLLFLFLMEMKVCDIRKDLLQDYVNSCSERDYFEELENGVFNIILIPEREQLITH